MKKLLLAGLLVVSAAAFGNTVTGNEQVSTDINYALRVKQPLALTVNENLIDFGMLARGEARVVTALNGVDGATGTLEGELGSNVGVTYDFVENNNIDLRPSLVVNGVSVPSGGTFVLDNTNEADFGRVDLGFGAVVTVKEGARSGEITETVRYTFRYQ